MTTVPLSKELLLLAFECDCRRSGQLNGLIISSEYDLNKLEGREVQFGEVLGKHSEVDVVISRIMFTDLEGDLNIITALHNRFGATISGYNPFDYLDDDEDDEDDED